MRITLSELRQIIRKTFAQRNNQRFLEARRDFDVSRVPGVGGRQSFERGQGIDPEQSTGFDVARIIGSRKSPTGTKRASLSAGKIQRWFSDGNRRRPVVSGFWGKIDDKNGIVPFKGVDWTVGLLFSEGARYVGSQSGIDYTAATEYNVVDPTGLRASPYSGYVYYINSREFIQIDNISVQQRADIFNKFRNATPEEKQYYIDVFNGAAAPRQDVAATGPASVQAPQSAAEPPAAPAASATASAQKFDNAKQKVKSFIRQPADYSFWAGIFGRESNQARRGKEGPDATFVKQVLGREYMKEWTPDEMQQLALDLKALSSKRSS